MKSIKTLLISAVVMMAMPWQTAMAATGTTAVTITFPDIVILHYTSTLGITFTAAGMDFSQTEGAATGFNGAYGSAVAAVGGLTTGNLDDTGFDTAGNPVVTVSDAWAVRGISGQTNARLQVAGVLTTAAATSGGSTVTLTSLLLDSPNDIDGSAFAGGTISFPSPGVSKGAAEIGDVRFTLDVSSVSAAGAHTGAVYTLTVTAI